jgi:hypothetical protein
MRRQAKGPLIYNVTQTFAATSGTAYTLSAFAEESQNGANSPDCSVSICGDSDCGPAAPLTLAYSPYYFQYVSELTESNGIATFSVQCAQSAYVALDNVTVVANGASASSSALATVYITLTQTVQQLATTTVLASGPNNTITEAVQQLGTTTALESGPNNTVTATATVQVAQEQTKIFNFTNTVPTVVWSTATVVEDIAATKYYNLTVSAVSTATSKYIPGQSDFPLEGLEMPCKPNRRNFIMADFFAATVTSTLNLTTTEPPSVVYETATAVSTNIITYTDYSLSISSAPQETFTTVEESTLPASTEVVTSIVYSTVIQTSFANVILPQATLPQITVTPLPVTTYSTITLPASTLTIYISVTLPAVTDFITSYLTPATQTFNLTATLPALS